MENQKHYIRKYMHKNEHSQFTYISHVELINVSYCKHVFGYRYLCCISAVYIAIYSLNIRYSFINDLIAVAITCLNRLVIAVCYETYW